MKKKIFIIFSIIALTVPFISKAHESETDGQITVLMHSNPDDDPIAGQPAALLFDVTDSTNKFDVNNCDCKLIVANGSKVLFTGNLLQISGATIYAFTSPITFPKKAVYKITVFGKPKSQASTFQSFKVDYDLRVDRQNPNAKNNNPTFFIIGGFVLFALIVGVIIYFTKH